MAKAMKANSMRFPPLFMLFTAATLWPLEPYRTLRDYKVDLFERSSGIIPHEITGIAIAPPGFLWASSTNGLLRFDGSKFLRLPSREIPGLTSKVVVNLASTQDGTLWFNPIGPGLYSYKDGKFRAATAEDGLPENTEIYAMRLGRRLLFGTRNGYVYEFRNSRFFLLPESEQLPRSGIRSLFEDRDGSIWVGLDSGLFRINEARIRRYGPREGNPISRVFAFARDRKGALYAGGHGGLVRLDGDSFRAVVHPKLHKNCRIQELLVDRNDDLWISTDGDGVLRQSKRGIEALDATSGLPVNQTVNMSEDSEGAIWIQTRAGLVRLRNTPILSLPQQFKPFASEGRIMGDKDGVLWMGTPDAKLIGFTPSGQMLQPTPPKDFGSVIGLLSTPHGLLVGQEGGALHLWTGNNFRTILSRDPRLDLGGFRLTTTASGDLFIGTRREGVWLLTSGHWRGRPQKLNFSEPAITALLTDRADRIWVGSRTGLFRANEDNRTFRAVPIPRLPAVITALAEGTNGSMWIGTPNGLGRLRDGRLEVYSESEGLDDSTIVGLLETEEELWIADAQGLCSITLAQFEKIDWTANTKLRPRRFTESDGMPSSFIRPLAHPLIVSLQAGRIAIATDKGPAILELQRLRRSTPAPPVFLDEVRVNGERIDSRPVPIPAGAARIEFTYTALTLIADFNPQFRYRMKGFQDEWTVGGRERHAVFTNLPQGQYHFEIASADWNGNWGPGQTVADVVVAGHFYQSTIFWICVVGLLAMSAWAGHRFRMRTLEREVLLVTSERNRIARELHDTVLQSVLGVVPTLNALAMSVDDAINKSRARDAVQQLESTMKEARRAIKALRAEDKAGRSLTTAIREAALRMTKSTEIQVYVQTAELPKLAASVEDNIYRIAVEAIRNAVKHSGAAYIEVCFGTEDQRLKVSIHDDGCGFESAALADSAQFGIRGMRERASSIGAVLDIRSRPNLGTSVSLSLPLTSF